MEETDQELADLLHSLNLPGGAAGACPVPALGCQERAAVRRRYAVFAGPAELIDRVRRTLNHYGGSLDPHTGFLLARGIKTLALRVRAHNDNATALAGFLAGGRSRRRQLPPDLPPTPRTISTPRSCCPGSAAC